MSAAWAGISHNYQTVFTNFVFIKLSLFEEGEPINVCVKKVINGHRISLGALRMAVDTEVIGF